MAKEKISVCIGIVSGVVSYLFGGFDPLLSVFCTILVVDTITGMLKAWNLGEYESSKFRSGFVKKSGYLIGIVLSVQIDIILGGTGALRDAVITFFVANEAFSIVENLGTMGISFPPMITNAIKSLNNKEESKKDER